MIKRSFFGIIKPTVEYDRLSPVTVPQEIPVPGKITLFVDAPFEKTDSLEIKTGQTVKSGQRLLLFSDRSEYAIAALGGTITSIFPHTGDFGRHYTGITIETDKTAETDDAFQEQAQPPSLESATAFLRSIPGGLPASLLAGAGTVETVVVAGVDEDLLCMTRQSIIKNEMDDVKRGIEIIKKISGAKKVVLAVPETLTAEARSAGVDVVGVGDSYPEANPRMIARKILGRPLAAGKTFQAAGIVFVSAEAVASLAKAYTSRRIPERKIITVIKKNGERMLVAAALGTPVDSVLSSCSQKVNDGDRIIFGGPMTGAAIYTESYPIGPETDAVMVQDAAGIPEVVDRACINCGECIRICPADIPVNVLIRYLGAGEYNEAEDRCDLSACIECGLCSFVCTARIPVFQYIKLGKYEFAVLNAAEAENA